MVRNFIAAALCMAIVAACAGGRKASMAPTSEAPRTSDTSAAAGTPTVDTGPMPGDPKAQIDEAWSAIEIESKRMNIALAPEPAAGTSPAAQPMTTPLSTDASCKHANNDRCNDSCTLSDSICKNAEKICRLATQLAPDEWAAGKCTQAKQTCESAHESCCTCK